MSDIERVDVAGLERALTPGDRVLLDTTVLAAYLDATEATHPVASVLLDDIVASGRNPAVISMVTVMEVLIRPLRASPVGHHTVLAFIRHQPSLSAIPVDLQVAQEAASIRAHHRFAPPDALIIATGIAAQVRHLVTNDRDWGRRLTPIADRIDVLLLRDYLRA